MGKEDNPRRLRNKIFSGSLGVVVITGGILAGITVNNQSKELKKQEELIHDYQQKLDEQGSLIDQQTIELKNQNELLDELKKNLEEQSDKLKQSEQDKEALKQKVEKLEEELAFKKADEEKAKASSAPPSRGVPTGTKMTVEATAYIAMCPEGCTGITATGLDLRDKPNAKVIAVDPNVIPLGTKVYIPDYGYAVAADTGGAIKGKRIDLHMPTSEAAKEWGRRTVTITILD